MTNIILTELTCNETEDNLGSDECDLRIWADAHYYNRRKDMTNGEVWNLNLPLSFEQRVKIQLWDIDNPGFPLLRRSRPSRNSSDQVARAEGKRKI